jgi:hypothetical protein
MSKAWWLATIVFGAVLSSATIAAGQDEGAKPAAPSEGRLPWEVAPRVGEPILRPPAGPREILERYDIGESQLASFFSGQPMGPSEEDVLIKILYRFPRLGLDNVARWRKTGVSWDQIAAAPETHRAEIFHVAGRVVQVEKRVMLAELADLYEFDHYYRVTLDITDAPYQAIVLTRHIPAAWTSGAPTGDAATGEPADEPDTWSLDERAELDGLFLKVGDQAAEVPQLLFAARRVAWLPDRPSPEQGIGPPQIALANLGVDWGLFDGVKQANGKGLGDVDREAFYRVLDALGKPGAAKLEPSGPEPVDVIPLLEEPEKHQGELVRIRGTAKRIMRVPVRDADIQRRFGIDHYYEIDLSLPLGETSVRFGKGENVPVYNNTFPATLNVLRLPDGLAEGERVQQLIRAEGVFFKVWSYRSNYMGKFGQMQPAPLFLAVEPEVVRIERKANIVTTVLVSGALGLAVLLVGLVVWWFGRSDRVETEARRAAAEQSASPDFSKLG